MQVTDLRYLELVDPKINANKFYLLVLYEDNGRYLVSRRWGSRGGVGSDKGKVPYFGANSNGARNAINKLYTDKRGEGYRDIKPTPANLTATINAALKAGMPALGGAPAAKPSVPMVQVPAPVIPKGGDTHTLTSAQADRSWSICRLPRNSRRAYVIISAVPKGGAVSAELFAPVPAAGSATGYMAERDTFTARYPHLLRGLNSTNPALERTSFDGYLEESGQASHFFVIDILSYRGQDVAHFSLARRKQLLDQAIAELKGEDPSQLPANWRLAPDFVRGGSVHPSDRLLIRHLADKYVPNARWFFG